MHELIEAIKNGEYQSTSLNLSGRGLVDEDIKRLCDILVDSDLSLVLENIDVSQNQLSSQGICMLSRIPTLRKLNVANQNLSYIQIYGSNHSHECYECMEALANHSYLEFLDISGNHFSLGAVGLLRRSESLRILIAQKIRGGDLGFSGYVLRLLLESKSITHLDFYGCSFGDLQQKSELPPNATMLERELFDSDFCGRSPWYCCVDGVEQQRIVAAFKNNVSLRFIALSPKNAGYDLAYTDTHGISYECVQEILKASPTLNLALHRPLSQGRFIQGVEKLQRRMNSVAYRTFGDTGYHKILDEYGLLIFMLANINGIDKKPNFLSSDLWFRIGEYLVDLSDRDTSIYKLLAKLGSFSRTEASEALMQVKKEGINPFYSQI